MNIIALLGSPRTNGSTAHLMGEVLKGVMEKGGTVKEYQLNKLNYRGCQGCFACKTGPGCVQKDDAQQILADVAAADGVILATPVYLLDMTGQMKLLLDRFFAYMNLPDHSSKLGPGKKIVWVLTQAQSDVTMFLPSFEKKTEALQSFGLGESRMVIAGGTLTPEDVMKQEEILVKARALGNWLSE